jgi:hypothetical protein
MTATLELISHLHNHAAMDHPLRHRRSCTLARRRLPVALI